MRATSCGEGLAWFPDTEIFTRSCFVFDGHQKPGSLGLHSPFVSLGVHKRSFIRRVVCPCSMLVLSFLHITTRFIHPPLFLLPHCEVKQLLSLKTWTPKSIQSTKKSSLLPGSLGWNKSTFRVPLGGFKASDSLIPPGGPNYVYYCRVTTGQVQSSYFSGSL